MAKQAIANKKKNIRRKEKPYKKNIIDYRPITAALKMYECFGYAMLCRSRDLMTFVILVYVAA